MVAPHIAERSVQDVIGKIKKISAFEVIVALKEGDDAQKFCFSRTWTIPQITLNLPSGKMELMNATFLVDDDDLAGESVLVCPPI